MTQFDDYFRNDDVPFSENLNDALLVSNVFDYTVNIELPKMYSDSTFVDNLSPRKAGVAIVTLKENLPSGISISTDQTTGESTLTGTGTVQFLFYPNFNSFGKIKAIRWTSDNNNIQVNLKTKTGTTFATHIANGVIENSSSHLTTLEEIIIELEFNNDTLHNLTITMENKKQTRYGANVKIGTVDGLNERLEAIETTNQLQDALITTKVDKVSGKGLSTNDYSATDKSRVSNLKTVAMTGEYNDLVNKPTIPTKTSQLANDGDGTNVFVKNNDSRLSNARNPTSHTHGNVSNDGKIGTTSGKIVVTGTNGVLQGADTITKSKISDFSHTHTKSQISDFSHTHTKSQITDFPTTMAPSSHAHGSITNDGKLATANGIVITDANKNITASSTITKSKISDFPSTMTPSSHKHGNVTNDGKIGTAANKPIITTTDGVLVAGSFGTTANTFCQGNDTRLSNARIPTAHTHGDISNTGAITSSIVDFSTSDAPIISDSSNSGKLQKGYVDTVYIRDSNAHSNIGTSAKENQANINLRIDNKIGGLAWKTVEDLSNFDGAIYYNDYFVYVIINKSGVKISTADVYKNLFSGTIPINLCPSAAMVQNNTGTVDVRIKINTVGTIQIMGTQTISSGFTVNIGFLYARV